MLKKTITYIDYDGNSRTEDFYFNLNETEVTEMEVSEKGGLVATIELLVKEENFKRIVEILKSVVLKAYGQKSIDGRRFVKSEELRTEFSQTEAFNTLFMELATNSETAAAFINGIIPKPKKRSGQPPQSQPLETPQKED